MKDEEDTEKGRHGDAWIFCCKFLSSYEAGEPFPLNIPVSPCLPFSGSVLREVKEDVLSNLRRGCRAGLKLL
jgi:hypothetical protein